MTPNGLPPGDTAFDPPIPAGTVALAFGTLTGPGATSAFTLTASARIFAWGRWAPGLYITLQKSTDGGVTWAAPTGGFGAGPATGSETRPLFGSIATAGTYRLVLDGGRIDPVTGLGGSPSANWTGGWLDWGVWQ